MCTRKQSHHRRLRTALPTSHRANWCCRLVLVLVHVEAAVAGAKVSCQPVVLGFSVSSYYTLLVCEAKIIIMCGTVSFDVFL